MPTPDFFDRFKSEQYHDQNLIRLVRAVARAGALHVLGDHLGDGRDLGQLQNACHRQPFDVELLFDNAQICIESKVDSNESRTDGKNQSEIAARKIRAQSGRATTAMLWITYGTAEYYIKRREDGRYGGGPYSNDWRWFKLDDVVRLVSASLSHLPEADRDKSDLTEWRDHLMVEQQKRRQAKDLLRFIGGFRDLYVGTTRATDYPNNRINISVPEFLFPVYSELAEVWNASPQGGALGRAAVYPVGRQGRVHDSILNFTELWEDEAFAGRAMTIGGILSNKGPRRDLYFEMNEDFNLHLKMIRRDNDKDHVGRVRKTVRLLHESLAVEGVPSCCEHYIQGTHVLYEWNVGLLRHLDNMDATIDTLARCIETALVVLR